MGELMRFINLLLGVVFVIFAGSDCHHALISLLSRLYLSRCLCETMVLIC